MVEKKEIEMPKKCYLLVDKKLIGSIVTDFFFKKITDDKFFAVCITARNSSN